MTRRVLEDSPPVLQQNSCHETFQPDPTSALVPDLSSAFRASHEASRDLLVPEDHPAVNEPSQEEAWLTRLSPRVALRKTQRYIENC